jgi:short-subunit dehydrogenase
VQAVLPGATATDFWAIGGLPVENLDASIVMSAEDLVDAALLGFERGEKVSIPSLHAGEKWDMRRARRAMAGQLSSNIVAQRYAAAH